MGWSFSNENIYGGKKNLIKSIIEGERGGNKYEIVAMSERGATWYLAVKITDCATSNEKIFGVVVLTRTNRRSYFNFGYKIIEETSGPCQCEAPITLINMLSPTSSEWANEWRAKCLEHAELRKKKNASLHKLRKLPEGTFIKVDYQEGRIFQVCKYMGKRAYIDWNIRRRISSSTIAKHNWEVVK